MSEGAVAQGVVVLGMHRSGTSAVAGALGHVGLRLPDDCFLLPPHPDNPRGYFENGVLIRVNDDLLEMLHAEWSAPPPSIAAWRDAPGSEHLRKRARAAFRATMPEHGWLWKDPRNCLTLPFWSEVLAVRPAAVIVHRAPGEIARSLRARDGFTLHLGMALWERYMRELLTGLAGLPVVVTRFQDVLDDPVEAVRRIRDDLAELGAPVGVVDEEGVSGFVSASLPGSAGARPSDPAPAPISREQEKLLRIVEDLDDRYRAFPAVDLPAETDSTAAFFEERRGRVEERRKMTAERRELVKDRQRVSEERDRWERRAREERDLGEKSLTQMKVELERLRDERLELKDRVAHLHGRLAAADDRYRAEIESLPVWFRKWRSAYRRLRSSGEDD